MKRIFYILYSIILPLAGFTQIPNGGFEDWTNMGNYSDPAQWGTLNEVTSASAIYTCNMGTPGYPGNSYLQLESRNVPGMGIMAGITTSGVINTITLQPVSGFPFTQRPESLKGNWQYMAGVGDQGYISVLLSRWNAPAHKRDTIASTFYALPGMVMSWKGFNLNLNYRSPDIPDSAIIVLSASNAPGTTAADGSYLYIDNLEFNGNIAGIFPRAAGKTLRLFPNPASGILLVDVPAVTTGTITMKVYDLTGKIMFTQEERAPKGTIALDVTSLPDGIYFLRLTAGNEIYHQRFVCN